MYKFWLALFFICVGAYADVPNPDFEFLFNRLPGQPEARKYQLGTKLREMHGTAICVYDFATQGGTALTQINLLSTDLKTSCLLPSMAVIRNAYVDVTTALAGGGTGEVGIGSGIIVLPTRPALNASAFDLRQPAIITNYSSTRLSASPVFATVSTYLKVITPQSVVGGVAVNPVQPFIVITGAGATALTAGHFRVFIDYNLSE